MALAIAILSQTIQVSDPSSVVVGPVYQDTDTGDYVREVRIFAVSPLGVNPITALLVKLRAQTQAALDFDAPAHTF